MKKYSFRPLFLMALIVPGLLLLARSPARGQAARAKLRPARGRSAPPAAAADEVALTTLDGQPASWRALRGKVVVVYLWASWCPPCLAGLPELEALAHDIDSSRVAVVLLALDVEAGPVRAALAGSTSLLPVYLAAAPVLDAFAPPSLPAVVVLHPSGQVAAHYEQPGGYNTPAFKDALRQLAQ